MEANELRIGNLIDTNVGIAQVTLIRDDGLCEYCKVGHSHIYEENLLLFKPIPLTEEILLKAGFYKAEYLEHIFQININGLYFAFDEAFEGEKDENIVGDFDECVTIRIPKYLHQLQNLYFALTGNELQISL